MIDSNEDNLKFRNQYPEFVFDSYVIEHTPSSIKATYTYKLGEYTFKPTASIPASVIANPDFDEKFVDYLFFNFGIINAINYYKLTIAPKFVIKAGYIDDYQKAFFKKLFYHGLGEFLYINNLHFDLDNLVEIECAPQTSKDNLTFNKGTNYTGNLIPVGGGKDSVVTLEALQPMHNDNVCFMFNRSIYPVDRAAVDCIKMAGYRRDEIASFELTLDPLMLQLNSQGFYNGHIPFSSCLAFAAYIVAYLSKKANIVLSNEASANEGNIAGTHINHQYSKSFEFEQDFQNYVDRYFSSEIHYFSLLRCINEYTIFQKFLHHPAYLNIFRSCNVGMREDKWCGHCAKCLFVFIMLYPSVSIEKLIEIFGHNMYEDMSLYNMLIGLINPDTTKPFECVGTKEEINYSIKLAIERNPTGNLPALLQWYKANVYNPNVVYNIEGYYNPEHHIPDNYLQMLKNV